MSRPPWSRADRSGIDPAPEGLHQDAHGIAVGVVVIRRGEGEIDVTVPDVALETQDRALLQRRRHGDGLRGETRPGQGAEHLPDELLHVGRDEIPDDGHRGVVGREEFSVESEQPVDGGRGDDLAPPVDGPAVRVSGEELLEDPAGRAPVGIVLHLVEFLQDDLFLRFELGRGEVETEEDVPLVLQGEGGVLGGQ